MVSSFSGTNTRSRRRPSAVECGRGGAHRGGDQRSFSSSAQSSQRCGLETKSRIRGEYLESGRERRRSIRTQLHARTASTGRGDTNEARNGEINENERSKRELVIGRARATERERERSSFPPPPRSPLLRGD